MELGVCVCVRETDVSALFRGNGRVWRAVQQLLWNHETQLTLHHQLLDADVAAETGMEAIGVYLGWADG